MSMFEPEVPKNPKNPALETVKKLSESLLRMSLEHVRPVFYIDGCLAFSAQTGDLEQRLDFEGCGLKYAEHTPHGPLWLLRINASHQKLQ